MYLGTICSTYMFRQNGLDELTYFPNRNNNLKDQQITVRILINKECLK